MKKLLILLLLSVTTMFTSINAQTNYSITFNRDVIYSSASGVLVNTSDYNTTDKITIIDNSIITNFDYFNIIYFWDSQDNYLGYFKDGGSGGDPSTFLGLFSNFYIPSNADTFAVGAQYGGTPIFDKFISTSLFEQTVISYQSTTQDYNLSYLTEHFWDPGDGSSQTSPNWNSTTKISVLGNNQTVYFNRVDYISFITVYDSNDNFIGFYNNGTGGSSINDDLLGTFGTTLVLPSNAGSFALNADITDRTPVFDSTGVSFTQFQSVTVSYDSTFSYPASINLDSNYGDYFDEPIQFQDQDELYIDYPISAQSADVNDDWQATTPTSGIGSFVFQDWYDIDNNVVFSTNPSLSITNPARDYNLRARYTGVTEYDIDLNMESGVSGSIQYQGNSFNNNSITQLGSVINQTVPNGTSWSATAPEVTGQSFDGWYNPNTDFLLTTNRTISTQSTTFDWEYEARYSPIPTYLIQATSDLPSPPNFSYQVNSDPVQSGYPINETVDENSDVSITAPTSNIGFYEFDGWYSLPSDTLIESNATITFNDITNDVTIIARYSLPEEYQIDLTLTSQIGNIQFIVDGGTPIFAPSISETIFAGQDFSATAPSDPSYHFKHWYDLDNDLIFSQSLFITAQDVGRDYNLEARYAEIFDITFDTAGGDPINDVTALDGEEYALPTPTREGYVFGGWFETEDPFQQIVNDPLIITGDIDLTARWIEVITISFNSNGGTPVDPQFVTGGGLITAPAIPSKFGYLFDGWYLDNNTFANPYDFESPIPFNYDFTIHAKWVLGSDSDVGDTLNRWIEDSGISSLFIVLVIMVGVSVTLGLINAQMFVIIISNLSIIFVFTALGFIPLWIVLVSGLALIGFIVMTLFGGSNNA